MEHTTKIVSITEILDNASPLSDPRFSLGQINRKKTVHLQISI
jgi:hypothetical protein